MSDKMTPGQLRDLADLWDASPLGTRFFNNLREEAARREAEAKELGRTSEREDHSRPLPQGEREGPGSAAAQTVRFDEAQAREIAALKDWKRIYEADDGESFRARAEAAEARVARLEAELEWLADRADELIIAALDCGNRAVASEAGNTGPAVARARAALAEAPDAQ
jgi:hypothetical protein